MNKEYILVSSCLIGLNTKYNGGNNYTQNIEKLREKYEVITFCAEQEGGLPTPRIPSEINGDKVINKEGKDVTKEFNLGAQKCLELVKKYGIKIAVLKESSPSCGSSNIYDGTFTGTKVLGMGFTAKLLSQNDVKIYTEKNFTELL